MKKFKVISLFLNSTLKNSTLTKHYMQYVKKKWTSLKDHKMKLWRILPAEGRQQFLLLHSALMTTSILSATRQSFFCSRAHCVNAELLPLHIGNAKKIPLCSSEASFCLLFHYFLQLFLKLKMEQNFTQSSANAYTFIPGRFEDYRP